jgi:hypothetical protein
VTSKSVHVVALSIIVWLALRPAPGFAQTTPCPHDAQPASSRQPSNFHVDEILQPLISALLARSDTFRRQWEAVNASTLVRVRVLSTMAMQDRSGARARSQVSRYAYGSLRATIEIPSGIEITELLPHELEHVIEQLEGLDLRALADRGDDGVAEIRPGVFETARARAAGLQVLREVYGEFDPAFGAAVGGLKRFFRGLGPRPGSAAPAAHLHKRQ